MGCDKALLPHPDGGTWLTRTLLLLQVLGEPVTLLSRHASHLTLAEALGVTAIAEPPPWDGPLRALARLMDHHPDQRLLLCPVDMPHLDGASLQALVAASDAAPDTIQLAHDGERLQPLLAVVPATAPLRAHLANAVAEQGVRIAVRARGLRLRVRIPPRRGGRSRPRRGAGGAGPHPRVR